jgi:cell shape-determining protein MreC
VYPKGLRIGRVVELRDAGGRLMKIAVVEPAVDLGRLEQVFVMLRRGPIMDLLYQQNRAEEDLPGPVSIVPEPTDQALAEPARGTGAP